LEGKSFLQFCFREETFMVNKQSSKVIIEPVDDDLRQQVEVIMDALAPKTFAGATVLIKPNMVGPSAPELGHTTNPELVRAIVQACKDRRAKVMVGDNPGGINRNSSTVASITGILDASEGCFTPISERVVEKTGIETGYSLIISRAILEVDYLINVPKFKTHLGMMITGAIKNTYGYVAGACKARVHVLGGDRVKFAKAICDIYEVRPPELNIMDAITAIEGNGPCHGGRLRKVRKLLAGTDALAVDSVMARMMGIDPKQLPAQKEAQKRRLGAIEESDIDIQGELVVLPDYKMPYTFYTTPDEEEREKVRKLYPSRMMETRITVKPSCNEALCAKCGDCELNCPVEALILEPEFNITDDCINCFCCVELCPEGALTVPDVEAFRHY